MLTVMEKRGGALIGGGALNREFTVGVTVARIHVAGQWFLAV